MKAAISRRERTIQTGTTTDRALLRGFLEQDRRYAAYAICDLEDREFERTRWGVAWADGQPIAIALPMTAAEQRSLDKQELELSTYRHMRRAVPWVLANASPEDTDMRRVLRAEIAAWGRQLTPLAALREEYPEWVTS